MSHRDEDHAAADAVVAHHSELTASLTKLVAALRAAARTGDQRWPERRQELASWLRTELLPHAAAEEEALYPRAAAEAAGKLLVDGMVDEHRAIVQLVAELERSGTAVDAAGAGRALAALFQVHLAKENDLVLPLLLESDSVSLAEVLAGMHHLLGEGSGSAGCGGHGCGCGGDQGHPEAAQSVAPVLSVDARLDVRDVPHAQRHARVLTAISELPADGALVLIAPHAPLPLLAEIERRFPGQIDSEWLQEGPQVWQLRLHRQFVAA
jgi:uncharacterized protein (DUF2249 family)/iron-sulfur cluster repair protein YtfE (RIC family)